MNVAADSKRFLERNFHALTHKNFRYFWIGQCVSLIGTWIQSIGQSWLVLSITGSPFKLGMVSTIQFLPVMFLSLFAGVIVDRFPKKKIIIITQIIAMCLAFILSALVFTKQIQYWHILVLASVLGLSNTFDMPARQAFTIEIAGKKDLMNAIALNSATFNLARIIGPSIGAVMMAYVGAGWCFLLNGLSFLAVLYGLFHIESENTVIKKNTNNILKDIKEGLQYIKSNTLLLKTVLMVTVVGIFVFNFNVLIPVFTKDVLHMDEKAYGFLLSSLGLGSFIGALTVSFKSKKGPKKAMLFTSSVIMSIMLISTGLSRAYLLTALFLCITGVFNIFFSTTANSTLQINSKDDLRGRVMSIYSLVFVGSAPIGSFFAGTMADKFGSPFTFIINGALTLVLILLITSIFRRKELKS